MLLTEKLRQQGADILSDAELLALLMLPLTPQHQAITITQQWLDRYQGLSGLFNTDH